MLFAPPGRTGGCPPEPPQNRTSAINAYGSSGLWFRYANLWTPVAHPLADELHEPRQLRYPLLFRSHVPGFQCILRVSQQRLHNPDTALPSSGSPRVGFAGLPGTTTVLRLPPAFPPHFVAFVWRYHRPPSLFVSPAWLQRGGIQSGLDVSGPPLVTHKPERRGGAVRVSQVPGESSCTFALLTRPRPRPFCPAITAKRCCPRLRKMRRPQRLQFRG